MSIKIIITSFLAALGTVIDGANHNMTRQDDVSGHAALAAADGDRW